MVHAGDMEKGRNADDGIFFPRREQREASQHGSNQVAVGEHYALGASGRAAGVGEDDNVFGRIDGDRRQQPVAVAATFGMVSHPRPRPGTKISSTLVPATASRTVASRSGTVRTKRAPESASWRVHLASGVKRIEHRRRATQRGDPVEGDGELRHVRADRGEDVPFTEALPRQTRGHAPHAVGELPVGQSSAAWTIDQRRLVGQSLGMPQDEGSQRRRPGSSTSG